MVWIFRVNTVSPIYQIYPKFPMKMKFRIKGCSIEPTSSPWTSPCIGQSNSRVDALDIRTPYARKPLLYFRRSLAYRIRPNYRTVRLGFSKLLGTLICGKICIYLLRKHNKKDQKKYFFFDDESGIFFLIFFIQAYVVSTQLNCIDKSMQFKWVPTTYAIQMSTHNICLYEEVDKKYTGCNLKTSEFPDCALIGICAVIRSNTVFL